MKKILSIIGIGILFLVFVYACGDSGGGGGSSNKGNVVLYATDDPGDDFSQVELTVNRVQFVHIGRNEHCNLLTTPTVIDIANLENVLQMLAVGECRDRQFNRLHMEFDKAVWLMREGGSASESCSLTSYKDDHNNPNKLYCNGDTCAIDINGTVNVLAKQDNLMALDFELKEFEVKDFGLPTCSVTMKVKPLDGHDLRGKKYEGYKEGLTGYVTGLPVPGDGTFELTTKWQTTFTVNYSGATYAGGPQPGIYTLLELARDHMLKVRVMSDTIDPSGSTPILATVLFVKAEGMLTALNDTGKAFTLSNSSKNGLSISVDYSDAEVYSRIDGVLANDIWVEVKLYGFIDPDYLAHEVEVEDEDHDGSDD
jgi:hypothetical protein